MKKLLPLLFFSLFINFHAWGQTPTVELVARMPEAHKQPVGSFHLGADGNFYGLSNSGGGGSGYGTIFKMTPQGVFTTVKAFTNTTGAVLGRQPVGQLILGDNGHLYAMTYMGGPTEHGTIFKLDEANTFTNLVNFTGNGATNKGEIPDGALTLGSDGNFYGTTRGGGGGFGTIFKMTPAGVLTTLASLSTSGPYAPTGQLTQVPNGDFYGMTQYGSSNNGTIFKLTSDNTFTPVVLFTGTTGAKMGRSPKGRLLLHSDGFLYGVTSGGGTGNNGTIFKMDLNGDLTTLVEFTRNGTTNRGASPIGGLTLGQDGNFYGLTTQGGVNNIVGPEKLSRSCRE